MYKHNKHEKGILLAGYISEKGSKRNTREMLQKDLIMHLSK